MGHWPWLTSTTAIKLRVTNRSGNRKGLDVKILPLWNRLRWMLFWPRAAPDKAPMLTCQMLSIVSRVALRSTALPMMMMIRRRAAVLLPAMMMTMTIRRAAALAALVRALTTMMMTIAAPALTMMMIAAPALMMMTIAAPALMMMTIALLLKSIKKKKTFFFYFK